MSINLLSFQFLIITINILIVSSERVRIPCKVDAHCYHQRLNLLKPKCCLSTPILGECCLIGENDEILPYDIVNPPDESDVNSGYGFVPLEETLNTGGGSRGEDWRKEEAKRKRKIAIYIAIGVVSGLLFLAFVALLLYFYFRRQMKKHQTDEIVGVDLSNPLKYDALANKYLEGMEKVAKDQKYGNKSQDISKQTLVHDHQNEHVLQQLIASQKFTTDLHQQLPEGYFPNHLNHSDNILCNHMNGNVNLGDKCPCHGISEKVDKCLNDPYANVNVRDVQTDYEARCMVALNPNNHQITRLTDFHINNQNLQNDLTEDQIRNLETLKILPGTRTALLVERSLRRGS
ncbi:hypothetical protein SNEBB_004164 [Seison nebaliae]|nr:hypothetical protein SNEBB_004164 [Seison nebaliae]